MPETVIHRKVDAARRDKNPTVVCRVQSGWVVLGDHQFLPGYCLLLPDPVVGSLNELSGADRETFLREWASLGDALLELTDAVRINYEILGNLEPALHAHVFPRYRTEPEEYRTKPVWSYDWEKQSRPFDTDRDREMMEKLRGWLTKHGLAR